jgi:hypothetical protein
MLLVVRGAGSSQGELTKIAIHRAAQPLICSNQTTRRALVDR